MALSQWKEAILEGIHMEIEEGHVTEKNLERIENLVEILHKEGNKVPKSVKEAYCHVALECTAKHLKISKESYIEAIRSIWVRRVMSLCDNVSCLVTRELLSSCRLLWTAYNNEKECESLVGDNNNIRERALVCLRKVVSELHPNFEYGNDDDDESEEIESSEESCETEPMVEEVNTEAVDLDKEAGVESPDSKELEPMVEEVNTEDVDFDKEVNTEVVDLDKEGEIEEAESPPRQIKTISTAKFNRVLGDLRVSKMELVNALREGGGPLNLNVEVGAEQEDDVADPSAPETRPKMSLMERRSTAQTFEWEDSSDESDKEMGDDNNKSSHKKLFASPLKRKRTGEGARRTNVPWSTAETLAVLKGYEKYGKNWKRIKDECPILERRTNGDIKDKFRVEMKRQERHP